MTLASLHVGILGHTNVTIEMNYNLYIQAKVVFQEFFKLIFFLVRGIV